METQNDYDGGWKEALGRYFPSFLQLCFPEVASHIDWSLPVRFLDKELQEIVRDAAQGTLYVDLLAEVTLRTGASEWVLIHVEVQSQPDSKLVERMWHYNHRISDRYARPVVSLAILADASQSWRPTGYHKAMLGCEWSFKFPICKLLDLAVTEAVRAPGRNPAAVVVAGHLASMESARDPGRRLDRRWQLTRHLYEAGFSKEDVLELCRLLDWMMALPEKMAVEFRQRVVEYEKEKSMPYVTSTERLARAEGRDEGWQQGRQEGRQEGWQEGRQEGWQEGRLLAIREDILDLLEARFSSVSSGLRERIIRISDETTLRQVMRHAAILPSFEEFYRQLELLESKATKGREP